VAASCGDQPQLRIRASVHFFSQRQCFPVRRKAPVVCLYYERLSALRAELRITPAEILGCVIAHEIGHLELGADSHSQTFLMRAQWDSKSLSDASKGQLRFSRS
jgi:hypothetical protein